MSDLLKYFKINKKQKDTMKEAWEKSGFLDGLKGHIKPNIARLFEPCGCFNLKTNECCDEKDNSSDNQEDNNKIEK